MLSLLAKRFIPNSENTKDAPLLRGHHHRQTLS